jgi:TRAP-type C4-dicarboxylate transport system permease small subunit
VLRLFDRLVRRLATLGIALAAIALLASMGLIVYSVVMRYALNQPVAWVDEMVGYLLVATVMLAAADTLLEGEHIAVDIVTERLSSRGRRLALLGGLVAVAASAVLLAVEGVDMVRFSQMVGLMSNGYMAVPMWIPQLLVPIGAVLMGAAAVIAFVAARRSQGAAGAGDPHRPAGIE